MRPRAARRRHAHRVGCHRGGRHRRAADRCHPVAGDPLHDQIPPRVAHQPGGAFLVVWHDGDDLESNQIPKRRFDAAGTPLNAESFVPATQHDLQEFPYVATARNGSAIAVWANIQSSGTESENVPARTINVAGVAFGPAIPVATGPGRQKEPRVAVGPDGSFTVVWWADEAAGPARDAQMRRFDAAGNALAEVIDVAAGEGEQLYPDVTVLPDGTIVVY